MESMHLLILNDLLIQRHKNLKVVGGRIKIWFSGIIALYPGKIISFFVNNPSWPEEHKVMQTGNNSMHRHNES